ncbi:MAG: single-stranded-DNA-specific exonuclease RecJ [Lautropia sp.]|nr:single-stranded-DNA-specific exonuclease RecJ [Lautropia sp.]
MTSPSFRPIPIRLHTRPVDLRARQMLVQAGVDPLLARLLAARGIHHPDDIRLDLHELLPPDTMLGLPQAVARLSQAIDSHEPVLVVGDYDCDGATAIAIAVEGLRMMGAVVDYLVPNRFENGYGLTPEVVDAALSHPRLGRPALLLTVDNGIASVAGVEHASHHNLPVIVTDHHLPADTLPAALAIVNPNQPGCPFPDKNLAGVGVMLYVLIALRSHRRQQGRFASAPPSLSPLLDLAALGTVADVVPLSRNNRVIVNAGLARIRAGRARPGIAALLQVARRQAHSLAAADLGFAVSPRINAAGRLSDMAIGVECLLAGDLPKATALAHELDQINQQRRELESSMRDEALAQIGEPEPDLRSLVIHDERWHHGIIGLVASRIKERHHRPSIALAPDQDGLLRGSGRSIPGVHLRDVLDLVDKRHPGLLLRFGGHAMAAGLTLPAHRLEDFRSAFEEAVRTLAQDECFERDVTTDGPLPAEALHIGTLELLDTQVWGQGFPPPLFSGRFNIRSQRLINNRHMKLEISPTEDPAVRMPAIFFGHTDALPSEALLSYRIQRDDYRGRQAVSLQIDQILQEPDRPSSSHG